MAIDPVDPDILYAGTGEVFRGNGVFKTIDGGTTWERLENTVPSGIGEADNYWYFVNRLAICPTNSQLLLAATSEQTNYAGKIYRSTDAGETWSLAQIPAVANVRILDLRFQPHNGPAEPDDPTINCIAGTSGNGAYYSTDGGATWTKATGLPSNSGRVELAYARSAPSIVYASVVVDNGQLYRSEDGGHSFHIANPAQAWPGSGAEDYKNCLWVDPVDPDRVLAGGTFLSRTTHGGFGVWQEASSNSIHVDHHMIVEAPGYNGVSNKTVYGVNDGGVYRTGDILAPFPVNWTSLNHGLVNTQFYGAAGNVFTGKIFGGTQDNGTLLRTPDSQNWVSAGFLGGDGYFCAADQTTDPYFYGEFLFLRIYRSTTGGVSKDYIYNADSEHVLTDAGFGDLTGFYANGIAPFILDPNDTSGQTLLAGGRHLWRSTNAREPQPSWFKIKDPIQPSDSAKNINAIAVAPGNSNIIWVGHNDGSVYYTTNGTDPVPIWTPASSGLPSRMCTRITVGPQNSQGSRAVYATFAGFFPSQTDSKGNVWKTLFSGTSNVTWTDIHHGLPSAPIYSLVISPFYPDRLYLGTEIGVFASSNGGDSWSPGRRGPANVPVFELFWMEPKLVAVTHGRGLFTLGPSDD
jgi:BNR/Asp-box repeat